MISYPLTGSLTDRHDSKIRCDPPLNGRPARTGGTPRGAGHTGRAGRVGCSARAGSAGRQVCPARRPWQPIASLASSKMELTADQTNPLRAQAALSSPPPSPSPHLLTCPPPLRLDSSPLTRYTLVHHPPSTSPVHLPACWPRRLLTPPTAAPRRAPPLAPVPFCPRWPAPSSPPRSRRPPTTSSSWHHPVTKLESSLTGPSGCWTCSARVARKVGLVEGTPAQPGLGTRRTKFHSPRCCRLANQFGMNFFVGLQLCLPMPS